MKVDTLMRNVAGTAYMGWRHQPWVLASQTVFLLLLNHPARNSLPIPSTHAFDGELVPGTPIQRCTHDLTQVRGRSSV